MQSTIPLPSTPLKKKKLLWGWSLWETAWKEELALNANLETATVLSQQRFQVNWRVGVLTLIISCPNTPPTTAQTGESSAKQNLETNEGLVREMCTLNHGRGKRICSTNYKLTGKSFQALSLAQSEAFAELLCVKYSWLLCPPWGASLVGLAWIYSGTRAELKWKNKAQIWSATDVL